MTFKLGFFCASAWLTLACSPAAHSEEETHIQPLGWDAAIRVQRADDESTDPHVFEMHLTAAVTGLNIIKGKSTDVYAYNGMVPGPEIRVTRGDRVIVHFKNDLPEATSVHWHGLRVDNSVDGVPGVTQNEVLPGETFTYDFVVPDAGTFWYHPHVRSTEQVAAGLYGSFVVTDPDEPPDLGDDLTLVLSDMSIEDDGQLQRQLSGGATEVLFGREGEVILVNGKVEPNLQARSGRRQRWRVINAATTRYFQLAIEGQSFLRFASDGGRIEHPVVDETIVVAPSERVEVILTPNLAPTTAVPVRWVPYDRGFGSLMRHEVEVMHLVMSDQDRFEDEPIPRLDRDIEPLDLTNAKEVSLELTRNDLEDGAMALGINGVPSWEADPLRASLGETQIWTFRNTLPFAHPMHLHGYFFQVLSIDGKPPQVREWKDTVDVHVDGETKIAVRFDDRPGMWMVHCHILDHADAGMMTMVDVGASSDISAAPSEPMPPM